MVAMVNDFEANEDVGRMPFLYLLEYFLQEAVNYKKTTSDDVHLVISFTSSNNTIPFVNPPKVIQLHFQYENFVVA